MNFKKFISGVSALTIAASAFAGMAVTASAASTTFTENFEGATYTGWTSFDANRYTQAIATGASATSSSADNKYLQISSVGTGNNGINTMLNATTPVTSGTTNYVIEFDARITNGTNQASHFYVASNSSAYSNYSYSNYVLRLGATAAGADHSTFNVNGNSDDTVTITKNAWNHYRVEVVNGHEYLTISGTDSTPRYEVKTAGTLNLGCKGLAYCTQRYYAAFAVDNVTLKTLSMPSLALDNSSAAIATGASTTVNGTVTKGTETDSVVTTASSSNPDVTVSVTDSTTTSPVINITSAGSTDTTATVTVTTATTGANADAAEVTTQTIDVAVGAVKYANVTVNYVDGSGNVLKTADTVSDQTVGLTYNATAEQMADIADVVINGIHYYCKLNASSATSVAVADGGSVLDLVFDKTEYTYDGTVTTNPNTTVNITGTSITGTAVNVAPVSNYAGVATAKLPAGTYTVSVSKTDYTTDSDELVIANGGANSTSVVLSPVDGVIYSQTFDASHVNLLNTNQRWNSNKYQMYNNANQTVSFGTGSKYNKFIVTVPGVAFTHNATYEGREMSLTLMNNNDEVVKLAAVNDAVTLTCGESSAAELATAGDLTVTLDTTKATDNLTVVYAGNTYTYTTALNSVTGLRFMTQNQTYIALSSIRVTGESIVIPDAPTSTFVAADWTSDNAAYTADGNKLTDANDNSVYGYKAEIAGNNGYSYSVKGYIESAESDGSTTLTFGTITDASPMIFYLVTDEALDLTNSRVYGVAE